MLQDVRVEPWELLAQEPQRVLQRLTQPQNS